MVNLAMYTLVLMSILLYKLKTKIKNNNKLLKIFIIAKISSKLSHLLAIEIKLSKI